MQRTGACSEDRACERLGNVMQRRRIRCKQSDPVTSCIFGDVHIVGVGEANGHSSVDIGGAVEHGTEGLGANRPSSGFGALAGGLALPGRDGDAGGIPGEEGGLPSRGGGSGLRLLILVLVRLLILAAGVGLERLAVRVAARPLSRGEGLGSRVLTLLVVLW